tara:strand:+ start:8340 stop:8522 length:183 start_codon:yes stop_codon:yes gene_type:complete
MKTKPGWQTSEAWLTGIVAWLMSDVMEASDDWRVQSAAAIGASIVAGFYIWSRTRVKGEV